MTVFTPHQDDALKAVAGCVVAAYNVSFDLRFLEYELSRVGVRHAPGLAEAGVGQPGQLVGRHAEIGVAQQVAGTDAQQVAILESP
jgi:hypothetical protein